MAVTRLTPGSTARCSPGVASLGWSVQGARPQDVVVEVLQRDAPSAPAPAVQKTGEAQLLVAALPAAATVRVRPRSGAVFPDGVIVSAELTLRVGGVEADQYLLPRADVSGTPGVLLLELVPAGATWGLSVPGDVTVRVPPTGPPSQHEPAPAGGAGGLGLLPPPPPGPVPGDGLVQRAAYAARRRTGTLRLRAEERTELHVAVDRSASVLPYVRDGAAQALLDVLLGVNEVAGTAAEVPVWELGTAPEQVRPALGPASVDGYWARVLGDRASTAGTLVAPLVHATGQARAPRTVVLVTDGVPADLGAVAEAVREVQTAGRPVRWHLLALARGTDDPQVRRELWRDELTAVRPLVADGLLTVSSVAPGRGEGWLEQRLADAAALEDLVATLPFLTGTA